MIEQTSSSSNTEEEDERRARANAHARAHTHKRACAWPWHRAAHPVAVGLDNRERSSTSRKAEQRASSGSAALLQRHQIAVWSSIRAPSGGAAATRARLPRHAAAPRALGSAASMLATEPCCRGSSIAAAPASRRRVRAWAPRAAAPGTALRHVNLWTCAAADRSSTALTPSRHQRAPPHTAFAALSGGAAHPSPHQAPHQDGEAGQQGRSSPPEQAQAPIHPSPSPAEAPSPPPAAATPAPPARSPPPTFTPSQQRWQLRAAAVWMWSPLCVSLLHALAAAFDGVQGWSLFCLVGLVKLVEGAVDARTGNGGAAAAGNGDAGGDAAAGAAGAGEGKPGAGEGAGVGGEDAAGLSESSTGGATELEGGFDDLLPSGEDGESVVGLRAACVGAGGCVGGLRGRCRGGGGAPAAVGLVACAWGSCPVLRLHNQVRVARWCCCGAASPLQGGGRRRRRVVWTTRSPAPAPTWPRRWPRWRAATTAARCGCALRAGRVRQDTSLAGQSVCTGMAVCSRLRRRLRSCWVGGCAARAGCSRVRTASVASSSVSIVCAAVGREVGVARAEGNARRLGRPRCALSAPSMCLSPEP